MTIYAVYFAEPINSKPFIQLKKNTTEYSWKNIEQSSKFDIKGIFGGGVGLRMKSHRIKSCNASLLMLYDFVFQINWWKDVKPKEWEKWNGLFQIQGLKCLNPIISHRTYSLKQYQN